MTKFTPELLALLQNPPLHKGESAEDYNSLLSAMLGDITPHDKWDWLLIIMLVNCIWEAFRYRRYKAVATNLQHNVALKLVIHKTTLTDNPGLLNQAVKRWLEDPMSTPEGFCSGKPE